MAFGQPSWIATALLGAEHASQVVEATSTTQSYGSTAGPFGGIGGAAITAFQLTALRMRAGHLIIFADTEPLGWVRAEVVPAYLAGPWPKSVTRRNGDLQPVDTCPTPLPASGRRPAAPVRRYLDASTAHLPADLGTGGLRDTAAVLCFETGFGFWMHVPTDPQSHSEEFGPVRPEVLTVQTYARAHGCDYVLFDADAEVIDDLPTWDW